MTSTTDHEDSTETKVTEVTAPSPTPTPTFHGFPNLPPELRLRIWKEACLPRTHNDRAIQYVTADVVQENSEDDDVVLFDEDLEHDSESDDDEHHKTGYVTLRGLSGKKLHNSPSTNSAYLWDQGLWMACRESRAVITKHLEIYQWLPYANAGPGFLASWSYTYFPSNLLPHRKAKPWCSIVVPLMDIFCISAANLRYLPKSLYGMELLAPGLGQREYTIIEHWAIALKFDSSWNVNFPADLYNLKLETTPRGLMANWIQMFQGVGYYLRRLWIIDDTSSWVREPCTDFDVVYRDCDVEYVEGSWSSLRDYTAKDDMADTTDFIYSLALMLEEEGIFQFDDGLATIGLLVRKDRELPAEAESEHGDGDIPDC
ncbi:hypothetical protein HYE68_003957 [Fusarium pseudograminearum]|nr:hypothetical protein HYE68_003957 [Fusarium pseudograminearum]